MIYNYIDDNIPEWARERINQLAVAGTIKGANNDKEQGLTDANL